MTQRRLSSHDQSVPPKIALPAIENASLEEDDELQDLWANLLASCHDQTLNGVVRSGFVDIIKQLEVVDVHILNYIYSNTLKKNQKNLDDTESWKKDSSETSISIRSGTAFVKMRYKTPSKFHVMFMNAL